MPRAAVPRTSQKGAASRQHGATHQSETIIDITSPRASVAGKVLKYLETGEEILVEVYHGGKGLE